MRRAFTVSRLALAPLLAASHLTAQVGSLRVSLPSPTAASLGKFGDIPVSLYTGVPDITIPLFSAKGRTLELPIALRYHAGGVRVEEIAGWAGLGWTLEAGGVITRTVRGVVDETPGGYYNTGSTFYNPANWPVANATLITNIVDQAIDGEPDRFFFNFAGRSGEFVMGPVGTPISIEYRAIPYQRLRIVPAVGGGGIVSWQVTTEDGTRYTFAAVETNVDFNQTSPGTIPAHYQESYTSSWQLTGIRSPGGDSLTLYYTPYAARHRLGTYREQFDQVSPLNCVPTQSDVINEYEVTAQRLDSIKTAMHTVRFTKGAALRSDALSPTGVPQEPRLDRITVTTAAGVVLRRFQFDHDYFPGNRLRLKNVYEQDSGGVSLPPYTFTYDGQTLPAITSYAQDHWGYYNGKTTNTTLIPAGILPSGYAVPGADREPDAGPMKAGALTRITYPTGGYTEAIALTAMQGTANMHSPVIERWVTQKVGATETVLQATLTSFKTYAAGQYLPYQTFVFSSPSGVTNFAPSSVTGGSFTKDSRYLLQETANSYDPYGRITQLTDPRSKVTNYQYTGVNLAFLTKVTRVHDATGPVDLVTDIAYDNSGFVSSIKDEGGTFRYFTYDLYGRLRQVKNNAGTPVRAYGYTYSRTSPNWTFNAASPNAIVDTAFIAPSVSVVSTQYFDGLGRPIQTVAKDGTNYHVTATQYDLMGRVWRTWNPYTRTSAGYDASFSSNATTFYNTYLSVSNAKPYRETLYTTDALSRVKQVAPQYSGSSPTQFVLSAYGVDAAAKQQYTEVTDESGKRTRTYFDIFNNSVKSILGYGATEATTTQLTYNVLGQRTQTTDPRGLNTTYTLDTRGLLTTRANPDAGTASYKYDKGGNLRYSQDANQAAAGQVYFTNFDFAGRALTSGQGAATFSTLNPDTASLPALDTTKANWLVVRAYDAKPATANFPWSSFSTQITPLSLSNVSGRLAAVASKSNGAWQVTLFSYDTDGRIATRYTYTQANGGASVLTAVNTTVTYTRDLRDALTQRSLTVGSSTFYQWYDYDNRGLFWKLFASTSSTSRGHRTSPIRTGPPGNRRPSSSRAGRWIPSSTRSVTKSRESGTRPSRPIPSPPVTPIARTGPWIPPSSIVLVRPRRRSGTGTSLGAGMPSIG